MGLHLETSKSRRIDHNAFADHLRCCVRFRHFPHPRFAPYLFMTDRHTATTLSIVSPNLSWSLFISAEAPNVVNVTVRPSRPTYRSQPNSLACSIATRADTDGGSTASR